MIAILNADKEGFLRSERSLIQIVGRAARNDHGKVIMYSDIVSDAMKNCIAETNRRRQIQEAYNKENNITPKTIIKFSLIPEKSIITPAFEKANIGIIKNAEKP
jgi:excinuclease ABC subunit B